jgi:hypothetical protein
MLPVFIVLRVLHSAAPLSVTLIPLFITTSSANVGTELPPHVDVLPQLPDTEAVLVAPVAW